MLIQVTLSYILIVSGYVTAQPTHPDGETSRISTSSHSMLGQTSSHHPETVLNPELVSNQQLSAGNEMGRDMSDPDNSLSQPAVPSLLGEPIHNNHEDGVGMSPLNHLEATSNEETSIRPLNSMTEIMSEEEKRALRAKLFDNIELKRRDHVFGPVFRALREMGYPNEIINEVYAKIIWLFMMEYKKVYGLYGFIRPEEVLDCVIRHDWLASDEQNQRLERFDWLIRAGAPVDAIVPDGRSYLCVAVYRNEGRFVKALLKAGASLDYPIWNGWDRLTEAITRGCKRNAQELMDMCVETQSIDLKNNGNSNTLLDAVKNWNEAAALSCIADSAEANGIHAPESLLCFTVRKIFRGSRFIGRQLDVLLRYSDKPNLNVECAIGDSTEVNGGLRESLLCFAVRKKRASIVETLLTNGANPNVECANGESLITLAGENDEMKRALLDFQSQASDDRSA